MARKMVESGQRWLGQIPDSWEQIRGKYVMFPLSRPIKDNDGVITCFRDGEVTLRSNRREDGFTLSLKEIGYQGINVGDLVVHGMDGFAGSIGISDSRGKASPVLIVLDAPNSDKKYLMYFLRTMAYLNVFTAYSTGIRVRSCDLSWKKLSEFYYAVPPLPEQQKIAAFLDDKCAEFDSLIADIQREIEKLERLKRSVIAEAVTKGLDKNAEMKDSGVKWIGEIPKDWNIMAFRFILNERNEKNIPIKTEERLSLSIDIGITLYADKTTNLDRFKEDVSQYKVAHIGDLVLNSMNVIVGAEGISNYFGCISPAYYTYYDNDENHYDARFCDYVFKCKRLRNLLFTLGKGIMAIERGEGRVNTCRLKVSRDDIGHLKFPFPSKEERIRIVDYLDARCAEFDTILSEKQKQIEILQKLKKSVIYEYVTGKKEVK